MDHAKTLSKIEAYAATLTGGEPDNAMIAAVEVNVRFIRWAVERGFERQKSAYNNVVIIPFEASHVVVMARANPLIGKFPAGSYIMTREPITGQLLGHRVDADEEAYGVTTIWRGGTRRIIPVDETEVYDWLAEHSPPLLAKTKDGSYAFSLPSPGHDVEFRMRFGIG